jgi:hypothetical protein
MLILPHVQKPSNNTCNGKQHGHDPETPGNTVEARNRQESDRRADEHRCHQIRAVPVLHVLLHESVPSLDGSVRAPETNGEEFINVSQVCVRCAKAQEAHVEAPEGSEQDVRRDVVGEDARMAPFFEVDARILEAVVLAEAFSGCEGHNWFNMGVSA